MNEIEELFYSRSKKNVDIVRKLLKTLSNNLKEGKATKANFEEPLRFLTQAKLDVMTISAKEYVPKTPRVFQDENKEIEEVEEVEEEPIRNHKRIFKIKRKNSKTEEKRN